jgi:hypothetical protein
VLSGRSASSIGNLRGEGRFARPSFNDPERDKYDP